MPLAWSSATLKNYGVDVTIVNLPRALPNEDADVSKEIEKYQKLGVTILTATKVDQPMAGRSHRDRHHGVVRA